LEGDENVDYQTTPGVAVGGRPPWSFETIAWSLWAIFIGAMSLIVAFRPQRGITHIYRDATINWWSGLDLYQTGYHGFLYFPSSAVLYSPFALLPPQLGGMAWRWLSVALLTWALCRLAHLALPEAGARRAIALTLLLLIPSAAINVVRAQSEIIMFALMALAVAELAQERWTRSALWLTLAVAIKPLALVMGGLVLLLVPALRWRLLLGLALMLALPLVGSDPAYVLAQYQALGDKLLVAAAPPADGRWNELNHLLEHFGFYLAPESLTWTRLAGAVATLGLCTIGVARFGWRGQGAWLLLAWPTCYLLLFNPRTEEGSYLNLALLGGLYAALVWQSEGRRRLAWALGVLCLGLGTQLYGDWLYRPTDLWLKPLLCVVFMGFLSARVLWPRPAAEVAPAWSAP